MRKVISDILLVKPFEKCTSPKIVKKARFATMKI